MGDMGARAGGVRARQWPRSPLGAHHGIPPLRRPLTHRTSSVSPGYSDLLTRGRLTRSSASSLSSASSPICGTTRVGKFKSPTKRNEGQYLMCSRRWRPAAWCRTAPSVTPKPSASQWMVFHCSKLPSSALHADLRVHSTAPSGSVPAFRANFSQLRATVLSSAPLRRRPQRPRPKSPFGKNICLGPSGQFVGRPYYLSAKSYPEGQVLFL